MSLFNNRYFLRELAELKPGTTVRVAFDIHDAAKVWIKDMHGRWIGEAEWEGNTKDAFPKAYTDQLKEKRVEQTVKRRQAQIQTARDELGNTLEHLGDNVLTLADFLPAQEPIAAEPEKTLLDFLPAETEETETGSYADTVMWLYGPNGGEELAEDEAAVG
ncbi:Mu transposase C-terminal domain-containing protein [Methylogaea oryzae]|uniref:Mu transposase C-terminal domain-containing protein n=1 Tax=Methylogaea oryzae TaxID=1295382 RepID=UPI0006CF44FD|nr:Mu transposase C-terminal domain-containing protein [Methylogaea oryzae]